MVAHYKIIQKHNPNNGDEPKKYYGKLIRMRTLSTPDVVHQIMERSSLKEGDITSVLMNLAKVINYNLMLGDAVKLEHLGTFSINLMSRGAVSPEKFTLSQHLKGKKINFLPDKMMKDNLKNMVLIRQKLDDPIR